MGDIDLKMISAPENLFWAGFNGIYLVRFGFRIWEILILKLISAPENSNKFQKKPGFGRKNQLRKRG